MTSNPIDSVRRREVLGAVATVFTVTAVGTCYASAQAKVPDDVTAAAEELGRLTREVEHLSIRAGIVGTPEVFVGLMGNEQELRSRIASTISEINQDYERLLWRHQDYPVAEAMVEKDLSPIKPGTDAGASPLDVKAEDGINSCSAVIVDVFLETMGIDRGLKAGFNKFLEERELASLVEEIGKAAKNENWARGTLLIKELFLQLSNRKTIELLEKHLGGEELETFLKRAGARFVPFVGWGLTIFSLSLAIWNNRGDIANCEFP